MTRMINADDLLSKLDGRSQDSMIPVSVVRQMIKEADGIDLVKCRECRYYREDTTVCSRYGLEDDDFCSWADEGGEDEA